MSKKIKQNLKDLIAISMRSNLFDDSAAMTFYFLLALLPLLLFAGNILTFLGISKTTVFEYVNLLVPSNIQDVTIKILDRVLSKSTSGVITFTVISAIWAMSKGVTSLKRIANRFFNLKQMANPIIGRIVSIITTSLMFLSLIIIGLVFSFGSQFLRAISQFLPNGKRIIQIFGTLKWPIAFIGIFLILLVFFYLLPNKRIKLRYFIEPSLFVTILIVLLSQTFSFYVSYFMVSINASGTIGAYLTILLWLYIGFIIIFLGIIYAAFKIEKNSSNQN